MPARKKSKPNPPKPTAATTTVDISAPTASSAVGVERASKALASAKSEQGPPDTSNDVRPMNDAQDASKKGGDNANTESKSSLVESTPSLDAEMPDVDAQPRPSRSWYGSWQRSSIKDGPSNRSEQNLSTSSSSVAPVAPPSPSQRDPVMTPTRRVASSHLSPGASSRSLPLTATTKLNITSDGSLEGSSKPKPSSTAEQNSQAAKSSPSQPAEERPKPPASLASASPKKVIPEASQTLETESKPKNPTQATASQPSPKPASLPANKATPAAAEPPPPWTSWFGKQRVDPQVVETPQTQPKAPTNPASLSALKDGSKSVAAAPQTSTDTDPEISRTETPKNQQVPQKPAETTEDSTPRPRSWLALWGGGKAPEKSVQEPHSGEVARSGSDARRSADLNASEAKADTEKTIESLEHPKEASTSDSNSGWAFWSRAPANTTAKKDVGELAVAGSSSQSQPENAVNTQNGMPKTVPGTIGNKRVRPASLEYADDARSISSKRSIPVDKKTADLMIDSPPPKSPNQRPVSRKDDTKHLLLPLFHQTYPEEPEGPSLLQQIGRLFYGKPPDTKHPLRVREPPRIKHALAIGIHGYFPTALMQTLIGRPTGTSIKFAEAAAKALHKYAQKHQSAPITVEKIALEGEGKIEERLDILWKLLLNWIDKIRHADFIIIACHSQGVPVAISLAAKLIGFGCIHGARLGICAMAGINLGPFVDYKSRFIGGSAGELFEFARSDSPVSKAYETALSTVVGFGAKVVYVGSMDDQLVSLQSSTFGTAEHANIYRAVWIDGRVHVADFLTHLVGFALKLRNLGVPDHGLVRELSNPLAGSLVGGEGHSRIYEDEAVYDLAVEFTAGTTSPHTHQLKLDKSPSVTSQNPYILPFAMRGVLEEEFVRTELADEALQLLRQFDDWKPTTKVLRDVKYRLEGVRSKL